MPDILIAGGNNLLAAQIAAGLLASPQHHITWIVEDLDICIVEELMAAVHASLVRLSGDQNPGIKESVQERLKVAQWQSEHAHGVKASEMWFLAGKHGPPGMPRSEPGSDLGERLFHLLADSGVQVLNYVGSIHDHPRGEAAQNGPLQLSPEEGELARFCAEHSIGHRFFLTSWLLGEHYLAYVSGGEIDLVLRALDEVIAEIQERSPEYFDFQALRILAPKNASLNLVPMDHAVRLMLDLVTQDKIPDSPCCIVSAEEIPVPDFCELLGEVYGVSMLSVEDEGELNAIDRLLGHQWSGTESAWRGAPVARYQSSAAAGLAMGRDLQAALLSSIREKQKQARTARDKRVSALSEKMQKRAIPRNGSDLTYYVAGTQGEHILVLNALGQPLDYWVRIIDVWMRRYRVILWETRGLSSEKEALRLGDHVDDIDAILRQEQIDSCHLVGWCTGPQAAVEFYARQPGPVLDMVFLSCAFKIAGHPELETAYGKNLESLCQIMIDKPAMTGSIRRALSVTPAIDINLEDDDTQSLAIQVLSLANVHLRNSVFAPFRTETSTFNYAGQILDLSAHHTLEHAAKVQVPILVLGCELDQVAVAAKSILVANLFSRTRHVELPGATHYSFYDRPELVASLVESFFQESRATATREEVAVAVGS